MSTALTVLETGHAELGASNASRWMACPGSVALSRGLPDPSSEFAEEGTAAHALAEKCLTRNYDASAFLGTSIEGYEVTEEMADAVQVYLDECRQFMSTEIGARDVWRIEQKFSLARLNPPAPMFGTADFVSYSGRWRHLQVVDLKYGKGVAVEAKGNKQLRYYALGALLAFEEARPGLLVDRVYMTIVQPRAEHPEGLVRTDVMEYDELLGFASELMDAARATLLPDAPLSAGPHCRFCRAKGLCPAQAEQAVALAQVDFMDAPAGEVVLPDPRLLPNAKLGEILSKIGPVEDYFAAVRAAVQHKLEAGEAVPGYKLVRKRATRQWANERAVRTRLQELGYGDADINEAPDLKSVAQIEKLVGKKRFREVLPDELVRKESSGYNVAREEDPRPALASSAEGDFTDTSTDATV